MQGLARKPPTCVSSSYLSSGRGHSSFSCSSSLRAHPMHHFNIAYTAFVAHRSLIKQQPAHTAQASLNIAAQSFVSQSPSKDAAQMHMKGASGLCRATTSRCCMLRQLDFLEACSCGSRQLLSYVLHAKWICVKQRPLTSRPAARWAPPQAG